MKTPRKSSGSIMRKYYQLILIIVCCVSIVTLLIYRHEYYRLRYVLEVLNFFGKPGLSEIEFCGPGFNATMLSEIVRNSSMEVRETPPLFQQIDENFYSYSSFLRSYQKYDKLTATNAHNIDTIVIGKVSAKPNFRCNIWLENNPKPKPGRFSFKIVSEPVNNYQLYIFHCSMGQNLGKPKGVSFYINDYNINPIHAAINRVIQVNTKRKVRERSSITFINNLEPAVCVIPNQVPLVTRDAFIEFLVFHHMMGVNYFTIYDSMISEDIIRRLNMLPPDVTHWEIQFFPLNYPFVFAKSYEIVRNAIELDCLFRHFRMDKDDGEASHAMVLSWDEFLVPRYHTNLKAVLDDFDPTRKIRTLEIKSQTYCLNQNDDDNAEIGYPDIMKKTHHFKLLVENKSVFVRNLDSMSTFDDIFELNSSSKTMSIEILGAHKYTECRDPKSFHPGGWGYNETQMQVFQHKFEGAMLKFGQSLVSNKIYRLYRSGQIWEKTASDTEYDVVIERLLLTEMDTNYVTNWTMKVHRKSRVAPYAISGALYFVYPITSNVTITVKEKLNLEYRPTPVNLHFDICAWPKKDKLVYPVIRRYSPTNLTCPIQGEFRLNNLAIDKYSMPTSFWPLGRTRIDFNFYQTANKRTLFATQTFIKVTEKPQRRG